MRVTRTSNGQWWVGMGLIGWLTFGWIRLLVWLTWWVLKWTVLVSYYAIKWSVQGTALAAVKIREKISDRSNRASG